MTEHFAGIIFHTSGITWAIIARIFPNAVMTNQFAEMTNHFAVMTRHFAVMTREILSMTREITGVIIS